MLTPRPVRRAYFWVISLLMAAAGLLWIANRKPASDGPVGQGLHDGPSTAELEREVRSKVVEEVTPEDESPAPPSAGSGQQFSWFTPRPFAVGSETPAHGWTSEDGRSQGAIAALAHNAVEMARLTEENSRIKRRQLVYRKDPAFKVLERVHAGGGRVQKLTLPAFDGQELEVEIVEFDPSPSGRAGTFIGRLPGREQSIVTLAFKEEREAFTVLSPEDGLYLQAQPREPGELIIVSFDPETFQPIPGGEPIKTQ